ncbi:MAG: hybrid sensor histidine kinase/response regulator [Ignavibacteriales bacterium UTCHB3]|nr:MAG: hybrid sensor histidine kinase/response regulator [Ignavibacteriales bacterium UTCHB3]
MEVSEKPAKILLVDDEEYLRNGVKRILQIEGFEVETAENGTEGIKLGTEIDFDVALLDLKMPDISGIEVLRSIREKMPNTICFMATAYASYETAVEATKLGAEGYILKPFTPDELIHNIEKGLQKRRLILEAERLRLEREARLLELAFERSRLNTIINLLADGVLVMNQFGEMVYYNPAALRLFDVDKILLAERIFEVLPPEVREIAEAILNNDSFTDVSQSVQYKLHQDSEQPEIFVEATCSPIPDNEKKKTAGVVVVAKDITQYKQIENLKSQFVSMVSHELKAPVAATIGFLDLLGNPKLNLSDEQKQDFLDRSTYRLKSLLTMVNDLLDISRIELNTVKREIVKLDLAVSVADIVQMMEFEAAKKKITIHFNKDEETTYTVDADKPDIERVITNLLSNAIKYNVENGEVFISLQKAGAYVLLEVKDTGIGMRPEEKERLFSEFFRAKNEKTKGIHGTGLGLSIVKKTIDRYAGKIEAESEYGKGSAFRVYLPEKAVI